MYWQERLDNTNKDEEIEEKIKEVRKDNPNYGYRRITAIIIIFANWRICNL